MTDGLSDESPAASAAPPNATPAILVARFQDAWNRHDMAAFARLFHPDATFVNRFGTYWRGVEAIVAGHADIHATIYSDSTLALDPPDIDPLGGDGGDDAAILHIWSRLTTGPAHPAGPHSIDTLMMAVVTRQASPNAGEWRIQALENVTLTNPRTGEPMLRG